jgi:hypothetical protein
MIPFAFLAAGDTPQTLDIGDWATIIGAVTLLLFGGGGVAAWLKQRQDNKNGVRQENRSDTDSLNARAVALVESQFNYLVKPLQEKLGHMEVELEKLRADLKVNQKLYRLAAEYIQVLLGWIALKLPDAHDRPPIPVELAEDVEITGGGRYGQ